MGFFGNNILNKFKKGENIESVNESTIYKGDGIVITVDGDGATNRNYSKDPYFKVYNSEKRVEANVARIRLNSNTYIKPHKGAPVMTLNAQE